MITPLAAAFPKPEPGSKAVAAAAMYSPFVERGSIISQPVSPLAILTMTSEMYRDATPHAAFPAYRPATASALFPFSSLPLMGSLMQ